MDRLIRGDACPQVPFHTGREFVHPVRLHVRMKDSREVREDRRRPKVNQKEGEDNGEDNE